MEKIRLLEKMSFKSSISVYMNFIRIIANSTSLFEI